MLKMGTMKELQLINLTERVPIEICQAVERIISMLDELYGAERDVEQDDGSFVLVAENLRDLESISKRYGRLDRGECEVVDVVKCKSRPYINALFLSNNEFGINVFMPVNIAPAELVKKAL